MDEPAPVRRVTIEYAGSDAALAPPIEHPGMYRPRMSRRLRWSFLHTLGGLFYSTFFILVLGWVATTWFPNTSRGYLRMPFVPALGMIVVAAVAIRLARDASTRGWSFGLWFGGLISLALYVFYTIGIGYFHWFVVP